MKYATRLHLDIFATVVALLAAAAHADPLYVADPGDSSVLKVAVDGSVTAFASFNGVDGGMTADRNGNLYVNGLSGVFKVAPDGNVSHVAISSTVEGGDLAFDSNGNLFAAINEAQIVEIAPSGAVTPFASAGEHGMAFDGSDNLYISEPTLANPAHIYRIDPGGAISTFASGLASPQGLVFDSHGNLYVAERTTGSIDEITPSGSVSTFATGLPEPDQLTFDSSGNLFVSNFDTTNPQPINEISPQGVVSTYASGLLGAGSIVAVVPEPSALALLIVGSGLTFIVRGRFRARIDLKPGSRLGWA